MIEQEPYFMLNEEWYYIDYDKMKIFLTDKAPEKAKKSYEEYLKEKEEIEIKI